MIPEPTSYPPAPVPSARIMIDGVEHAIASDGSKVPLSVVKPQYLLQDDFVRSQLGHAIAASDQMSRLLAHFFEDLGAFEALLAEKYGAKIGGKKGNKTLMSYDGLYKVQVQIADSIVFGPELQVAKSLVDECLIEWSKTARAELKVVVTRAFNTDKEGQVSRSEMQRLLSWEITDERWQRGMQAIRDAMRVIASKSYVRFYQRETTDGRWQPITIDLARA